MITGMRVLFWCWVAGLAQRTLHKAAVKVHNIAVDKVVRDPHFRADLVTQWAPQQQTRPD